MTEGREVPHEPLDVLDTSDLAHFGNGQNLIRICFDAVLGDDVPQNFALGDPKGALSRFSLMLKCLRLVKVSYRLRMMLLPYQVFMMMSSMQTSRLRSICPSKQDCIHHS
jgi:hypothetical protein